GRLPELDQLTETREAVERALDGVGTDGIVSDVDAATAGDLPDPCHEFLLAVEDRMVASEAARDLGLILAADGADDGGAEVPRPLTEQDPDEIGRAHV